MDDTDARLAKGKTSVLSDPSAIARRKRMEIRKFKKLSSSTQVLHDESLSLEKSVVCLKRPRIAQTAMEFIDVPDETQKNDSLSLILYTEEARVLPLAKGKESTKLDCVAPLNDTGLLRNNPLSPMIVFSKKAGHSRPDTDIDRGPISGIIGHPACSLSESLKRQRAVPPAVLPPSEANTCSLLSPIAPSSMAGVAEHLEDGNSKAELVNPLVTAKHGVSSCRLSLENAAAPLGPTVGTSDAEMVDLASRSPSREGIGSSASLNRDFSTRSSSGCNFPPSGKLLVCGRRREMEDTATIALSFSQIRRDAAGSCLCVEELEVRPLCTLHFFAVYDGHGGSQASNFCMENLHLVLAKELSSVQDEGKGEASAGSSAASAWERAMISCFSKMDRDVGGVCPKGVCDDVDSPAICCSDSIAPENVGTTAIVAVVSLCQIVVANCGDSRAVLSRGGMAIPLSRDHKPNRDDENSRIEAAGGRVIHWDGHRVGGLLALSRAIGDRYLKRYVISKPEVTCLQRTEEDECLILASDGLWDVISNDTACEIARKCLSSSRKKRDLGDLALGEDPACAAVAALLIKLAYGRGSKDNISAVVIDLKA